MMTDTTITPERATLPQDAMEMPHMMSETFARIATGESRTAPQAFASLDRAALLARFWTQRPRLATCTACGDVVTLYRPLTQEIDTYRCPQCSKRQRERERSHDDARAARVAARHARHQRAWELRQDGWSYQRIADHLGYRGVNGAYRAVQSAEARSQREGVA